MSSVVAMTSAAHTANTAGREACAVNAKPEAMCGGNTTERIARKQDPKTGVGGHHRG